MVVFGVVSSGLTWWPRPSTGYPTGPLVPKPWAPSHTHCDEIRTAGHTELCRTVLNSLQHSLRFYAGGLSWSHLKIPP